MKSWKNKTNIISQEIFQYSLGGYLLLMIFELVEEGSVSNFINLDLFLGAIFISGIIAISTHTYFYNSDKGHKFSFQNSFVISVIGAFIVFISIQNLGDLSIIITFFSFSLILILGLVLES